MQGDRLNNTVYNNRVVGFKPDKKAQAKHYVMFLPELRCSSSTAQEFPTVRRYSGNRIVERRDAWFPSSPAVYRSNSQHDDTGRMQSERTGIRYNGLLAVGVRQDA